MKSNLDSIRIFKSEIRNPNFETISKFKCSKPIPDRFRNSKQLKADQLRVNVPWFRAFGYWSLGFV